MFLLLFHAVLLFLLFLLLWSAVAGCGWAVAGLWLSAAGLWLGVAGLWRAVASLWLAVAGLWLAVARAVGGCGCLWLGLLLEMYKYILVLLHVLVNCLFLLLFPSVLLLLSAVAGCGWAVTDLWLGLWPAVAGLCPPVAKVVWGATI